MSTATSGSIGPIAASIKSTIVRQVGAGVQTILVGARSISVIVISGAPTLAIGAGGAVTLDPGMSFSWGADSGNFIGNPLVDQFLFTGIVGSDFIVTSTRE